MAAAAAVNILGNVIGSAVSADKRDETQKFIDESIEEIKKIGAPPEEFKPLLLSKLQNAGIWSPKLEQAIDVGVSKVSEIQESPEFRQKQLAALQSLEDISKTGLFAGGRQEFNKWRLMAGRDAKSRGEAITQQFQARGLGLGGAELAARLSAGQSSELADAEAADRIAAQQEAGKMQALSQMGSMATQLRQQEFGMNLAKSEAADKMRMFDVSAQREMQRQNIAAQNLAAQYGVQNQQRIMDANTMMANQELMRQSQARRQHYLDQINRQQILSQAKLQQAGLSQQQAQAKQQSWSQIGGAVGQGIGAIGQYKMQQPLRQAQEKLYDSQADYYDDLMDT